MCISGTLRGLQVTNQSSEIADDRPSAACEFAPDGSTLATGAWSGLLKLWLVPDCQKKLTIKAHDDRVTGKTCQLHCCELSAGMLVACLSAWCVCTAASVWCVEGPAQQSC